MKFVKICAFFFLCGSVCALETADRTAIQKIIQNYTDSWNFRECRGFADGFAEDADFVNVFGMKFSGRKQIEERHTQILQTLLKGSKLKILDTQLREVQPGLVIASVSWRLDGFRKAGSDINSPGEIQEGIFTQVFIHSDKEWEITASQNTLKQK